MIVEASSGVRPGKELVSCYLGRARQFSGNNFRVFWGEHLRCPLPGGSHDWDLRKIDPSGLSLLNLVGLSVIGLRQGGVVRRTGSS